MIREIKSQRKFQHIRYNRQVRESLLRVLEAYTYMASQFNSLKKMSVESQVLFTHFKTCKQF